MAGESQQRYRGRSDWLQGPQVGEKLRSVLVALAAAFFEALVKDALQFGWDGGIAFARRYRRLGQNAFQDHVMGGALEGIAPVTA